MVLVFVLIDNMI